MQPRTTPVTALRLVSTGAFMLTCACSSDDGSGGATGPNGIKDAGVTETGGDPDDGPDSGAPTASVPVTGPVTGGTGQPFTASLLDLDSYGYSEKEFFYAGDATAYSLDGEMTEDGKWTLGETTREPFKSRLLVRRPVDAADFNGTVVLEWLNVSGGADGDPGFMYNWEEILREGYAWVGVSAQATGVEGGGFALVAEAQALKEADPERYGSLSHPGDAYSFDIYTRAAEVVRGAGEVDVLEGLEPERLIAYGESQSAMRLVSYVNGVHPLVDAFDGFFIHSRSASGVPFDNDTALGIGGTPARIRDDLDVPVFQFQTETDVVGSLGYLAARQPDSDRIRSWEVAGTSHADKHILDFNGGAASVLGCEDVNDGPQQFVIKAALHALHLWMTDGTAPPKGDPLEADESGNPVTDEHGNTLGGVRTPDVDVPIATLGSMPVSADGSIDILCSLFGHTTPFSSKELEALYPTHDDYVTKVTDSADAAREAGFLLEPEAQAMIAEAGAAPVPR